MGDTVGMMALMIPILAVGGTMVAVVVMILTAHQRKMAEILRRQTGEPHPAVVLEIERLREEVRTLRSQVHEMVIRQDTLTQQVEPAIPERLGTH